MARSDFSKAPPVAQSCPQCGGEMRVARREPAPGNPAMERLVARMREMRQHRREDAGEEEGLAWRSGRKPALGRRFAAAHNSGDGLRDILTDLHRTPCEAAPGNGMLCVGPTSPDIKNKVGWGDARDTHILAGIRRGCGHRAAGRVHRTSAGLPEPSDPRAHHHQRRRLERHLHARARRRARQAHGHDLRHRESSRRHAEPRHPRMLGVRRPTATRSASSTRIRWSTINGCSRACRSIRKPRCSRSSISTT